MRILLCLLLVVLAGCRQISPGASAGPKVFHLRGRVVSTDPATGEAVIDHGEIPGFMSAMTMPYKLAQPETLQEIHPGDVITARLLVEQDAAGFRSPRLDELVVVGQARPDYKPRVQYHVPQPGESVPDFSLLNQSGKQIHLAQFHGRAVLLTFIYTRCPLAEFCPRMSNNFAEIDKGLAADAASYTKTHLLSVSFDPKYDTPAVLRSYGGAHTGRFTAETFDHWEFAAPSAAELPKMEQFFDVGVTPGDNNSINHTVSTVLLGKDGRVVAFYPTNDWAPAEVLARLKEASLEPATHL